MKNRVYQIVVHTEVKLFTGAGVLSLSMRLFISEFPLFPTIVVG